MDDIARGLFVLCAIAVFYCLFVSDAAGINCRYCKKGGKYNR